MIKTFNTIDSIEADLNILDSYETVQISSLSLMKMLRDGKAGVPIEVMGLVLGKFIDQYTLKLFDVFAMPQSGTGVSVEAIDPVFQTKMLEMLSQIGFDETVVGWYHSHPGFGCWLSGVDINTHQSFENLNKRCIAVVIDPIQSVKGKIVVEAYRLFSQFYRNHENREVMDFCSSVDKRFFTKDNHGLNTNYYSLYLSFDKNFMEEIIFSSIYKKKSRFIEANEISLNEKNYNYFLLKVIENLEYILNTIYNFKKKKDDILFMEKKEIIEEFFLISNLISKKSISICVKFFLTSLFS